MNRSNDFSRGNPENSSMTTINILSRLRMATEQIRKVQTNLSNNGDSFLGMLEYAEILDNVGKEFDGILYNLVDILSDDTRQSEINITSNDGQISKWLEQTFSSKQQRTITTAGRFESIKAIIQASSFVNALQKQLRMHTKESIATIFHLPVDINQLNHWSFNIMEYNDPITFTILLIFDAHDLISHYRIDLEVLKNLAHALAEGYTKFRAPYHNDYHGADVLQTTHCFLTKSNLLHVFTQLEITALLFAAIIHDFEHPGLNNNYLVRTKSDLALIYNDFSVLENHHSSSIFKLLRDKNLNIWLNMNSDEYRIFRSLVISLVLATDMANHASLIDRMSTYFFFKETNSTTTTPDSKTLLQIILHAADISNAAKPWSIYIQSAEKITEEFFLQGDLEKVYYDDNKPTFDRESTDVVQLQIGFISHIVYPTFDVLSKVLQIDSLDHSSKLTTTKTIPTFPWQYDLQLNLETWRQVSKDNDVQQILINKKPLKLNLENLQTYVEKAKDRLKRRSQHELLLRGTPSV
ncbi:unnamed protein product [Rotaria sordida]|uniref:Phosphodiesterase n=1 Tax=Rotaria sordida TaxID=392033 RepID=A0A818QFT7_9BILA|nr:unnamed protein product [Rotaria sordida]CAF3640046.1 unnamed protein product [Rotaria sordida]